MSTSAKSEKKSLEFFFCIIMLEFVKNVENFAFFVAVESVTLQMTTVDALVIKNLKL